ncbi:hypothetical protein RB195_025746 [Necator americanus]|uniref:Uncharacterized protein n=1 Tax=Necator americanus TaxID=51031 RepID=A0ABR1EUA3_NECAM
MIRCKKELGESTKSRQQDCRQQLQNQQRPQHRLSQPPARAQAHQQHFDNSELDSDHYNNDDREPVHGHTNNIHIDTEHVDDHAKNCILQYVDDNTNNYNLKHFNYNSYNYSCEYIDSHAYNYCREHINDKYYNKNRVVKNHVDPESIINALLNEQAV